MADMSSPWVWLGAKNDIGFNIQNKTQAAIIGASEKPKKPNGTDFNSKLHINSSGESPQITMNDSDAKILVSLYNKKKSVGLTTNFLDIQNSQNSVVMGVGSKVHVASNTPVNNAVAIGANAYSGANSVALGSSDGTTTGNYTNANASNSIAIGYKSQASNDSSVAIGSDSRITATNTVAVGRYSIARNSGAVAIGSSNSNSNYTEATGTGSIAIGGNPTTGQSAAKALKQRAVAIGTGTTAKEMCSTAIGSGAEASAQYATAVGNLGTKASGDSAVALGYLANATKQYSTAIGYNARAIHNNSVAIGASTNTTKNNQIVIGNGSQEIVLNGPITLGNSSSIIYIPGTLAVGKYVYTGIKLAVGDNSLWISNSGDGDNQGWVRVTGPSNKNLRNGGGSLPSNIAGLGCDRRLKNVGKAFEGGLSELKKLDLFHFTYKADSTKTPQVGVMAQDLQKVFPTAVTKGDDGYLRIRWDEMFYALINAVKELDKMIDNLKNQEIATLKQEVKELKKQNQDLEKRLERLEKKIK